MSQVAEVVAAECGTVVASAVNAENSARDKWSKAGKALYKVGVRVEALTKGSEESPNPAQDDALMVVLVNFIVGALTASVKPMRFDSGSYTVGALIMLTREELRDADDKVLSQTRRYWQQQVGSLFGLIRRYVDRVQNPDKVRSGRKVEKVEKGEKGELDPIVFLQSLLADKVNLVDMSDVDRFENSILEAITCLRAKRK